MPRKAPPKFLINDRGEIEDHTYRPRKGRPIKWNFARLEVGDPMTADPDEARSAMSAAATYKARNPGWDYVSRKIPEGTRFIRTK